MAKRERRHSKFGLDVLVFVEVNRAVNHGVGFAERGRFVLIEIFCLEFGKEVFAMTLS